MESAPSACHLPSKEVVSIILTMAKKNFSPQAISEATSVSLSVINHLINLNAKATSDTVPSISSADSLAPERPQVLGNPSNPPSLQKGFQKVPSNVETKIQAFFPLDDSFFNILSDDTLLGDVENKVVDLSLQGIKPTEIAYVLEIELAFVKQILARTSTSLKDLVESSEDDSSNEDEEPLDESSLQTIEITYKNGTFYSGQVKVGIKHGKGMLIMINGHIYEGDFRNGRFHGQGTYTTDINCRYEGTFRRGKFCGFGTLTTEDFVLTGIWKRDNLNGTGAMYHSNDTCYEGEFVNGKYEGYGALVKANGARYEGQFIDGNEHGEGVLFEDGVIYKGTWSNGKLQGKVMVTMPDGNIVEVVFEEGDFKSLNFQVNQDT